MERRYKATRFLVGFLRLVAWTTLVLGMLVVVLGVYILNVPSPYNLLIPLPLLSVVFSFVILLTAAESLKIVLDMEEHQRAIRELLERRSAGA